MKNKKLNIFITSSIILAFSNSIILFSQKKATPKSNITVTKISENKIIGEWNKELGKGGGENFTYRNHIYNFEVKGNIVDINLSIESIDVNTRFQILDKYGETVLVNEFDSTLINPKFKKKNIFFQK